MHRQIKDRFYDMFLKDPTKENFRRFIEENPGEMDDIDFKEQWVEKGHLAKTLLAMGNSAAGGGRKYDEDNDLYYEAAGDFSAVSGI